MPKNRLGKVSFTSHRYHVIRKYESIQSVKSEVATRSREKNTHTNIYTKPHGIVDACVNVTKIASNSLFEHILHCVIERQTEQPTDKTFVPFSTFRLKSFQLRFFFAATFCLEIGSHKYGLKLRIKACTKTHLHTHTPPLKPLSSPIYSAASLSKQ